MATSAKTVLGVKLDKVVSEVLAEAYEKALGHKPFGADTPKMVQELVTYFQKTAGDAVLECDNCGGGSPPSFDKCPFCGEGDEDNSIEMTDVPSEGAVVPEAPKSAKKVTKLAKRTLTDVIKAPPAATAEVVPAEESVLDDAVKRVHAARDAGAHALWTMSVELRRIYDEKLWMLRTAAGGVSKYKSFAKFIEAEVDLHERTVWRMIEVTKQFQPEQAKKYGVSILRGLLSVSAESRAEILDKVDAGEVSGKRGVQAEVQKIKEKAASRVVDGDDDEKKSPRGKAAKKASAAAAEKAAEKRKLITVALPAGRKTLKLQAFTKKNEPTKRAKKVADRPWASLECANGVTLYFALVQNATDGGMDLTVEAKREE